MPTKRFRIYMTPAICALCEACLKLEAYNPSAYRKKIKEVMEKACYVVWKKKDFDAELSRLDKVNVYDMVGIPKEIYQNYQHIELDRSVYNYFYTTLKKPKEKVFNEYLIKLVLIRYLELNIERI